MQEKVYTDISKTEVGYISPDGEIFGYEKYTRGGNNHGTLAEYILEGKGISDPEMYLSKLGWVKYTPNFFIKGDCFKVHLTQEQKNKLLDYMSSWGIEFMRLGHEKSPYQKKSDIELMSLEEIDYLIGILLLP